jgi:hypothetical protein
MKEIGLGEVWANLTKCDTRVNKKMETKKWKHLVAVNTDREAQK